MRLFTAIAAPPRIAEALSPFLRWTNPANLHITTKFIGAWPEERLEALIATLQPLRKRQPFRIVIDGLGWYPNPHSPRVFFAAVHADPDLATLARDTETALESLGIPREQRPYSPHLTLARVNAAFPLHAVRRTIADLESTAFGAFEASTFHLFESQTLLSGAVYTGLSEIAFTNPA